MEKTISITAEIRSICSQLLEKYKDAIGETGHTASGNLARTATYRCEFDGRYFDLIFNLESYWKYLEYGTKPHFPPISDIEKWITVKRLVPSSNKGKPPTTKQLAFSIARGISIKGTKPTGLLQTTINRNKNLVDALCDAILDQIEKQIDEELETL